MSTNNNEEPPKEDIGAYLKRTWRVWLLISCVLIGCAVSFWLGAASACEKGGGVIYRGACIQTNVIDTVNVCEMKDGKAVECNEYVPIVNEVLNITYP